MRILPTHPDSLTEALSVLRSGGVIAHATETCYGLACDLTNLKAVEKLFMIKNRPTTQPVSGLFASLDIAKQYVSWIPEADEPAKAHLPGPLTLILPLSTTAPHRLFPMPTGGDTIGIRVSSHPIAEALALAFGKPISTTSANLHGQPPPYSIHDLTEQFGNADLQPDLILDSGTLPKTPPSTVLDLTGGSLGGVKRQGEIRM